MIIIIIIIDATQQQQHKQSNRDRSGTSNNKSSCQHIRQIPTHVRNDFKLAYFYQKYTESYGIPVISSNKVSLNGLKRACYVLKFYLANSIELREHFYKKNLRVVVLASSESLLNIPEFTSILASNQNMFNSIRGLSPTLQHPLITVGEENALCSANDKLK